LSPEPADCPEKVKVEDTPMNHSLLSADRGTHVKIVVVALVGALAVVIAGISAHVSDAGNMTAAVKANGPVVKAGAPAVYSNRDGAATQ
jgi:hypothetical protein